MAREMAPTNDNGPPSPAERREKIIALALVTTDVTSMQLAEVEKVLEAHGAPRWPSAFGRS